ncbi:MAG: phosphoribosyl-ATP pyrophosphatase [Pseudomonadota bacterium]|jgi:phosphoribosyl-ATP pyrophosphohydrolase
MLEAPNVLHRLMHSIEARKNAEAKDSYVASVLARGVDHALKKVGEEATEFCLAAKAASLGYEREAMVKEAADLWFHTMIALAQQGLSLADLEQELARREGVSGHTEKASRS